MLIIWVYYITIQGGGSVHLHESDYVVNTDSRQADLLNKEKTGWNGIHTICTVKHTGVLQQKITCFLNSNKMLHSALRTLLGKLNSNVHGKLN